MFEPNVAEIQENLRPEQRVHGLWWEGSLDHGERVFSEPGELEDYLRSFVAEHR